MRQMWQMMLLCTFLASQHIHGMFQSSKLYQFGLVVPCSMHTLPSIKMLTNDVQSQWTPLLPTFAEVIEKAQKVFGMRPCSWQIKVVMDIHGHQKDIMCISRTGSGKLPFCLPLLFTTGIQIIITPLNILSKQNETSLEKVGIKVLAISRDTMDSTQPGDDNQHSQKTCVVNCV